MTSQVSWKLWPGLSHYKVFHPIVRDLVDRGHEVVVISYFPGLGETHENLTEYAFEGQEVLTNAFSLKYFFG
ncbi:glucosyl/glucuronosyl transferase [Culex quinquefasciatus]|uniref:Glucosyl/glucuronosyl transferase n=1 Tax=Culex quinquefasciatus TaxID=7176 RepID=B0WBP9_CULQU|nr:glucosyl/glucuronosyl transferase [Culex quinquefasciatus]|eukprot:XP_001846133.1 glucosyl/glucuronosyl transferase [Culex quinquefasciatus]